MRKILKGKITQSRHAPTERKQMYQQRDLNQKLMLLKKKEGILSIKRKKMTYQNKKSGS